MGGGLLYVTPVYTQRQGSTGSYPALRFVVVRFGQSVGIGDTLQQALDQVFQGSSGGNTGEGGSADGNTPTGKADNPAATKALSEAQAAFAAADKALTNGDLATYQKRIQEAQGAVQRTARARSLIVVDGRCAARSGLRLGSIRGADFEIGKAGARSGSASRSASPTTTRVSSSGWTTER